MKHVFALAIFAICSTSWAFPAPDGTYTGKGQLVRFSDGTAFAYDVTYVIAGDSITASYAYPNGYSYTLPFVTQATTLGQFAVSMQNTPVGKGHCIGSSCHVEATFPISGVLNTVSLELIYTGKGKNPKKGRLIVSGMNKTSNTAFEDVLSR